MDSENLVTIIHIGTEGGSLLVKGTKEENDEWKFLLTRDEGSLNDFLDEDDQVSESMIYEKAE